MESPGFLEIELHPRKEYYSVRIRTDMNVPAIAETNPDSSLSP